MEIAVALPVLIVHRVGCHVRCVNSRVVAVFASSEKGASAESENGQDEGDDGRESCYSRHERPGRADCPEETV